MSVLIKGMKMPNNCMECAIRGYDANAGEEYCPFSQTECLRIGLQKDCPLVEVKTTHGRLIDADAVISRAKMFEEITGVRLNSVHDYVSSAPTVIDAEDE